MTKSMLPDEVGNKGRVVQQIIDELKPFLLFIIMLILCKKVSNREKGDLGIFYPYIL